jgi:hypothetical protein
MLNSSYSDLLKFMLNPQGFATEPLDGESISRPTDFRYFAWQAETRIVLSSIRFFNIL